MTSRWTKQLVLWELDLLAGDSMRLFPRRQSDSHKNHIHYFTALKGIVGMLRSPEHTESVFDIEDGLRDTEAYALALEHVKSMPESARLISERYLAPSADIDALLGCPTGSLGHSYAHHIVDQGFDPDYFRKLEVVSDLDYLLMRIRQTHDIWHVVTGLSTSRTGELGLKAFELAQLRRPLAAVITAGGVMRYLFKEPDQLGKVLEAISQGYQLGLVARPFIAQKWELEWNAPLADWRRRVGVPC